VLPVSGFGSPPGFCAVLFIAEGPPWIQLLAEFRGQIGGLRVAAELRSART